MNPTGNNDRERVLASTDLVRLIGEHVQLRPKGREFAGLCPFHDDKNPSMQVSPQKQIYKCFSCGAGGTCFDFVMGYHKLTFPEAMKMLADRAGIELTPYKPGSGKSAADPRIGDRRKRLLAVNELALAFYRKQLADPSSQAIRDYVTQRGISDEMVERFQIGYAPHSWHALAQTAADNRWDRPALEAAGLIAKSEKGGRGHYDKLRHRLIFPICDEMGRAIAFGGRTLPNNQLDDPTVEAKYLNSPETLLFNKSRTLYGLDLAKKAIIDSKAAVIVEGYTDVVACHQHGRCNVVAALGTAFTAEHANKLRRFCEKVVLVFDGDDAGHKAADRAVEVLLNSEIDVAVVILPQGQDPDELLASDGGEAAWDQMIADAKGAMPYLLDQLSDRLRATGTISGKQALTTAFLTKLAGYDIASMPAIRRALILATLSDLLHLPEREVLSELKRLKPRVFTPAIDPVDQSSSQSGGPSKRSGSYESDAYSDFADAGMDADTDAEPYPTAEDGYVPIEAMQTSDLSEDFVQYATPERISSSKLPAIAVAEWQIVACLLRDNSLFDATMPDGADFCEAVPPGELTGTGARVFQLLHDRFADGASVDLPNLLAELAERGWHDQLRWLTQADTDLDAHTGGDPAMLKKLFLAAAQAMTRIRKQLAFEQDRRLLVSTTNPAPSPEHAQTSPNDPAARAIALANQAQRLAQQRRDESDPGRIARGL